MSKQLTFTYKDKEYTLEFTRKTVTELERKGLVVSEFGERPMTVLPTLFAGAFLAHHRYTKQEVIDDIFKHMVDKEGLVNKLAELYNEPMAELVEEPEEGDEGNVNWTASW
ncbi:MAG: DUF5055 domain-containing protein [Clostridia bacterium]|nr:DUF5055 domain-containing protein [Clostridia bacterium]